MPSPSILTQLVFSRPMAFCIWLALKYGLFPFSIDFAACVKIFCRYITIIMWFIIHDFSFFLSFSWSISLKTLIHVFWKLLWNFSNDYISQQLYYEELTLSLFLSIVACIPYLVFNSNLKGAMQENNGIDVFRFPDPKLGAVNNKSSSSFCFLNAFDSILHSSLCNSPFSQFSLQTVMPHLEQVSSFFNLKEAKSKFFRDYHLPTYLVHL